MAKKQAVTVTIDGQQYNVEELSKEVGDQLTNIQVTDEEIARLNNRLAICQTARAAYGRALSEELKKRQQEPAKVQ